MIVQPFSLSSISDTTSAVYMNGLAIVVPMTTRDRGLPFHPAVQLGDTTGYAMTDQIKSISTQRLKKRHSEELSAADVVAVKFALRRMIDVT